MAYIYLFLPTEFRSGVLLVTTNVYLKWKTSRLNRPFPLCFVNQVTPVTQLIETSDGKMWKSVRVLWLDTTGAGKTGHLYSGSLFLNPGGKGGSDI